MEGGKNQRKHISHPFGRPGHPVAPGPSSHRPRGALISRAGPTEDTIAREQEQQQQNHDQSASIRQRNAINEISHKIKIFLCLGKIATAVFIGLYQRYLYSSMHMYYFYCFRLLENSDWGKNGLILLEFSPPSTSKAFSARFFTIVKASTRFTNTIKRGKYF